MAISRRLAFLCLAAIFVCSLFVGATGVCDGDQDKGDQCREEYNTLDDDDFDDTFKIVDNVRVSLSGSPVSSPGEGPSSAPAGGEGPSSASAPVQGPSLEYSSLEVPSPSAPVQGPSTAWASVDGPSPASAPGQGPSAASAPV